MKTYDTPSQRISLHLRCLRRRPGHALFHLQGIAREIPLVDRLQILIWSAVAVAAQVLAFRTR